MSSKVAIQEVFQDQGNKAAEHIARQVQRLVDENSTSASSHATKIQF